MTRQNTEVDRLKQALKDAQKLKQTNTSKVDKVSTEKLKDHDEKVTRTDKHITKSKEVLEKRKVAEASIIELNTKIKAIETKLAPPIVNTPVERARLL